MAITSSRCGARYPAATGIRLTCLRRMRIYYHPTGAVARPRSSAEARQGPRPRIKQDARRDFASGVSGTLPPAVESGVGQTMDTFS